MIAIQPEVKKCQEETEQAQDGAAEEAEDTDEAEAVAAGGWAEEPLRVPEGTAYAPTAVTGKSINWAAHAIPESALNAAPR